MVAENNILNINSFLNKIFIQESNFNRYICPECPQFGTQSKFQYEKHLNAYHMDFTQISCIYCSMNFAFSEICHHIDFHFEENLISSNICQLCSQTVKMDCEESIFDHLMFQHNNILTCPICVNKFDDIFQLSDHINENIQIVFHCNYEKCSVKTDDKEELNFHQMSCMHHKDEDLYFEEHVFNCLFYKNTEKFKYENDYFNQTLFANNSLENDLININSNDNDFRLIAQKPKENFDYIISLNCTEELIDQTFNRLGSTKMKIIKMKLLSVNQYFVGVLITKSKRTFYCSSCDYTSQYSHSDIRKHIILSHCGINHVFMRKSLRIVKFQSQEINSVSVNGDSVNQKELIEIEEVSNELNIINDDSVNPKELIEIEEVSNELNIINDDSVNLKELIEIEKTSNELNIIKSHDDKAVENSNIQSDISASLKDSKEIVNLESDETSDRAIDVRKYNYVLKLSCMENNFQTIFSNVNREDKKIVKNKLKEVSQFSVGIAINREQKLFYCLSCDYMSRYNHADIRKHICLIHLSIPSAYLRRCLKVIKFSYEDCLVDSNTVLDNQKNELSDNAFSNFQNMSQSSSPKIVTSSPIVIPNTLKEELPAIRRSNRKTAGKIYCGKGIWKSRESYDQSNSEEKLLNEDELKSIKDESGNSSVEVSHQYNLVSNPIVLCHRDLEEKISSELMGKKIIKKRESRISHGRLTTEEMEKIRLKISECGGIVPMKYSEKVFDKLFRHTHNEQLVGNLKEKMEKFKSFNMKVTFFEQSKLFTCCFCQYESPYHQGDIKKHILAKHCGIKGDLLKECIRLCRVDSYFELLPDREIIRAINEENLARNAPLLSDQEEQQEMSHEQLTKKKILTNFVHPLKKIHSNSSDFVQKSINLVKRKRNLSDCSVDSDNTKMLRIRKLPVVERRRKVHVNQEISLGYSETILKALCNIENISHRFQEIKNKMQLYCKISIRVGTSGSTTIYICSKCNWFTVKSFSYASSHIIHEHTGLVQSLHPLVEMSAKLNNQGFLMSDDEISEIGWKNSKPILSRQTADNIFIDLTNY